jgi:NADH-ubiquinone oxidoreductase chain 2
MLFVSSTLLLLVNAVTLRRERSILFNRLAILILLYSGIIGFDSLYIKTLDTGIGIFGGLFHSTSITHSFNLFLSIIGAIVLLLTAFYPRRLKEPYSSAEGQQFFLIPRQKITSVFTEYSKYTISYLERYKNKFINKMGEQFTIIEYPYNYFITGFCDGESSFNLSVIKSNNKLG